MPLYRPSALVRSGMPDRDFESSMYCRNARATQMGSRMGTSPRLARLAKAAETNIASLLWSRRPPRLLCTLRYRASLPSITSVAMAIQSTMAAGSHMFCHTNSPMGIARTYLEALRMLGIIWTIAKFRYRFKT